MAKSSTTNLKKRVSVKPLKARETKLGAIQMKKVKGGYQTGGSGSDANNLTIKLGGDSASGLTPPRDQSTGVSSIKSK